MQSTGIVRRIDELGRFVIPKEMRRYLGLERDGAQLEIFLDKNSIILKKYREDAECCIFCGSDYETVPFAEDKHICVECILKIKKL